MKSKIDLFIERQLLEDLDTTAISTKVHGEERVHVRSEVISGAIEGFLQRMKNTNYCWICETAYDPALAPQCPTCHTLPMDTASAYSNPRLRGQLRWL